MRKTSSFAIEEPTLDYIGETRGRRSRSQRVNELLARAIRQERYEKLEQEAAEFFASQSPAERAEARAFQRASLKAMARD